MKAEVSGERLVEILRKRSPRPLSIQEIMRALGSDRYDRRSVRSVLEQQVASGVLRRMGKTRYQWVREFERKEKKPARTAIPYTARARGAIRVEGIYTRTRTGHGFVEVLGRDAGRFRRDVFIPDGQQGDALHGDRVAVDIERVDRRTGRPVGEIVAVTWRAHERLIGVIERRGRSWWTIPETQELPPVELTSAPFPTSADIGRVALVRITRPPTAMRVLHGQLERILGHPDDPDVQFLSIVFEHGLRFEFPEEVRQEADALPTDPSPQDYAGREDLRDLPFVTIDSETARDFDDAVCLLPLERGGYRLLVAIADVSHYVTEGTEIDREAILRGNSTYFPDRAIPMLPERLSNQLCSLNPNRDRLVMVVDLAYGPEAKRRAARFVPAVIRSRARLTYTKVAAALSETDLQQVRTLRVELGDLLPQLQQMHVLMRQLYSNRIAAGSLDLDLPEALIDLSEEGRSVGVRLSERNDAHRIIEEFMLEANRAVAEFLTEQNVPLPYRVHEPPEPRSIEELNEVLQFFGFQVEYDGAVRPHDVQRMLARLETHPLARVLTRLVLRSLKQAHYSVDNDGHFGLAFDVYCHFTSPIRRYPDLLVHRQLKRILEGKMDQARHQRERLAELSMSSSQTERKSMEAERAMVDLKKAEFMLGHLLEPEPGTVVGVTGFGLFVELDAYPIEGLIALHRLPDDRYHLDEAGHVLIGNRGGRRYRLGDRLVVEAISVSTRRRQIDLVPVQTSGPIAAPTNNSRPERPRRRRDHGPRRGRG